MRQDLPVDQSSNLVLCASICSSLPNYYKWRFRASQGFGHVSNSAGWSYCLRRIGRARLSFRCNVKISHNEVSRQINKSGTRSTEECCAVRICDEILDHIRMGRPDSYLGMRRQKRYCIHFLETAFVDNTCFDRPGKHEQRPVIYVRVPYLCENEPAVLPHLIVLMLYGRRDKWEEWQTYTCHSMQNSWTANKQTDSRTSRQVTVCTGSIAGRLLVS